MENQSSLPNNNLCRWQHDGTAAPRWIQAHMVGRPEANGTFLVATPDGQARVNVGDVVVQHQARIWVRSPGDIAQLLAGLAAAGAASPNAIGPGKRSRFGTGHKVDDAGDAGRRRTNYHRPSGQMPSIEWVHTTDLSVDQNYQRSIGNAGSRRLIASIATNFDWRLCAPLVVSRRGDGSRVIIDGQHRWAAAIRRADIPQLPCCLFSYDSPEEEAKMFILANRVRKPMNRLDDFHAALAAADEDALEVQRLVSEAGLTVARNTSSSAWKIGDVAFTSSIALAVRRHGAAVASAALINIAEAYQGCLLTHGGSVFGALVRLLAKPPESFDPDQIVPALRHLDMATIGDHVRGSIGGDSRAVALHDAILGAIAASAGSALAPHAY